MKYLRVKLVGFGLAMLTSSAIAADDGQKSNPVPEAKPKQAAETPKEQGPPPATVQFTPAAKSLDNIDPIWFSASKSSTIPVTGSSSSGPIVTGASGSVLPASSGVVPVGGILPGPQQTTWSGQGNLLSGQAGQIKTISNQVPSLQASQPLVMRVLLPWLFSFANQESWPPVGPRVGIVPPDPVVPNAADLPPISEPPTELPRGTTPAPTASNPLGGQSGSPPAASQLPLPVPLQSPPIPQVMPAPQQQSPSPKPAIDPQAPQPTPTPPQPSQPTVPPVTQPTPQPTQIPQQPAPPIILPQPRPANDGSPPATSLANPPTYLQGQAQGGYELPTAPPELMVPAGAEVPGKKGTFGSDPIRLSRDYPSLSDLCGTPIRDRLAAGLMEDPANSDRGFIEAEYLMWWMRGLNVPVLGTTSTSPTGTGFLGQPGTVPVIGPGTFLGDAREGVRVRGGFWLDDCKTWEVDGSFFVLAQRDADAAVGYDQYSVITRPIYSPNPIPGTGTIVGETGEAVSVPGILDGVLSVHAQSILFGGDANLSRCLFSDCNSRASVFVGYRNLDLIESLTINENIEVVGSGGGRIAVPDPVGTLVNVQDRFGTQNYFNGGQIGGTYQRRWGRFDLDARASIAFGVTEQELDIDGFQTKTLPGQAPQTFRGGLLAVGPNLGDFTRDRFSVAPEVTLNIGYWLLPNLKAYVGYNFLYWTNVIRPGNQIDSVVNLAYVPNSPAVGVSNQVRPEALFQQSNMLVHGVQFGIEWKW